MVPSRVSRATSKAVEPPQAIAPFWGADVDGAHPNSESQVFRVAEFLFDGPAFRVEIDQVACGIIGGAGGQAPPFIFDSCSGFTLVTARWIAQAPKVASVTRLWPDRLRQAARELLDLSTTTWVEPSPTGVTGHRSALNYPGYCAANSRG